MAGIRREALLCRGELWPVLEANIRRYGIDLVIVGTHGRDGLSKLFLGSVAEKVFRQSPCPVLTVGPHAELDCLEDGGFRRVVYATNFSPSALHALPFALTLADQNLTLLHVLARDVASGEYGTTVIDEEDVADAREHLRQLVPGGRQNASLIVMGVDPSSQFAATHLPWATAHRVLCDAHRPVLTVR